MLLMPPKAVPKGVFLFFPGGEGYVVTPEGRPKALYTRGFSAQRFVTAIVDVPSDQPWGTIGGDRFRKSNEHLEDVKKIIDFVYQRWPKPIFLIGHSAGTTSVAYLASVLKDDRIGAIILTASLGDLGPKAVFLGTLPLGTITYPTLFIHHKEDPCTSFEAVYQQHRRLINSPRVNFIEVLGGDRSREIPCSPVDPSRGRSYAHGFSGHEREVAG